MEKRLTVDLNEDAYKKLVTIQLQAVIDGKKKQSLNDLLKEAVEFWIKEKESKIK